LQELRIVFNQHLPSSRDETGKATLIPIHCNICVDLNKQLVHANESSHNLPMANPVQYMSTELHEAAYTGLQTALMSFSPSR